MSGPASNKRPSRSNSVSSSIVTVKKSASLSSRNGSQYLRNRSTSPDSISRVLHSLNNSRSDFQGQPDTLKGRKAANGLNVNRWSHSTSSSLSAIDADLIRKRTSSIRRSVGAGYASNASGSISHGRNSQDYKIESRGSPKRSASTSNRTSPRPGSRLVFQDSSNLKVVQDLSKAPVAGSSQPVNGTTWEQNSGFNKFGEPIQSLSFHYTTNTLSTTRASDSASSDERIRRTDEKAKTVQGREKDRSRITIQTRSLSATNNQPTGEPSSSTETRSPKRRDMLSRALAKANEAVILDNAQRVNAAIEAYNDACELLQQVMVRSVDPADRRKLLSIKATYSRRIAELHDFDDTFVDLMRPLPDDPPIEEYDNPEEFYHEDTSYQSDPSNDGPVIQLPLRQESLLPEIFGGDNFIHDRALPPIPSPLPNNLLHLPMDQQYMPPPLSPRPQLTPIENGTTPTQTEVGYTSTEPHQLSNHLNPNTWLGQPDESSSHPSSRLSSVEYDRKDEQLMSAIEDAMNAAVDSAYNDDLDQDVISRAADKASIQTRTNKFSHLANQYLDDDAEEEEQLLEEVVNSFESGESQFDHEPISALPRASDSSVGSGRTWGSSVASTLATRTTLSTLAESIEPPVHIVPTSTSLEEQHAGLKKLDPDRTPVLSASTTTDGTHVGIRDRRMSGQSAKQLKIETFVRRGSATTQPKPVQLAPSALIVHDSPDVHKEAPSRVLAPAASFSSSFSSAQPLTPMLSVHSGEMPTEESPATPALTFGGSTDDGIYMDPSPSRHGKMGPPPPGPLARKNLPASNLGKGSLSINTGQLEVDSPITPGNSMFSLDARKPSSATSAVSTPGTIVMPSIGLGGMYLFEDHLRDPRTPRSPHQAAAEPVSLEPCPDAFLLRPFWLTRCLYQALAHPRGGYISTKLFIPRDIWRVRNVKIKALEDKIAQCDLLTAALQKLAKVDTLDANAVLEELQSFEVVLDQIRLALSKKLGSDVGISGSSSVFKLSPAGDESIEMVPSKSHNTSSAAKSIASGWRKLRSKSSSANLTTATRNDLQAPNLTMASLPMTSSSSVTTSRTYSSHQNNRHPIPNPSTMPYLLAPHAYYITSLARLFDAVQILDSIARQVEDPGLKCSSQTHVGLELSVRNAAEFFAFYILRFVMADILMLLDKFLKRGGEWVMA